MLIERRAYTFRPGCLPEFWRAQSMLGFDPDRRLTMGRLIGYFVAAGGAQDQVVHLWRFDGYDDWMARLHRPAPEREPYFKAVRPLMLAQENRFLVPAPVAELTPLWGNGRDWLPGAPPVADLREAPDLIVEETTFDLLPGSLAAYWDAYRAVGLGAGAVAAAHVLGCFYTLVGRQHQVVLYRCYGDVAARDAHRAALAANAGWQAFTVAARPLEVARECRLMTPAPLPPMGPLFRYGDAGPARAG